MLEALLFGAAVTAAGALLVAWCFRRDRLRGYQKPSDLLPLIGMLIIVVGMLIAATSPLLAAPKAQAAAECKGLWDIALFARANAIAGVEREKTVRAMGLIYSTEGDERLWKIMLAIVDAALRADAPAPAFAALLLRTCVLQQGDMDAVLGSDV